MFFLLFLILVVSTVALGACLYVGSHARKLKPFGLQPAVSLLSENRLNICFFNVLLHF